jgi:hypothetical protein
VKATLRLALPLCLILGSVGVAAAEAQIISYTHFVYLAAENLLAISVVLAVALAFTLMPPPLPTPLSHPAYIAVIAGVVSALASLALVLIAGGDYVPYEALIALLMGAAVGGLSYVALTDADAARTAGQPAPILLYAALAALLVIAGALRLIAPGSPLLTFVFAPILYFLLPGLALTFALLPHAARLIDHLVYAAPISIGAQFIVVAWCVQVGIALTPLLIYVGASAIIVIGFGIALIRQRRELTP